MTGSRSVEAPPLSQRPVFGLSLHFLERACFGNLCVSLCMSVRHTTGYGRGEGAKKRKKKENKQKSNNNKQAMAQSTCCILMAGGEGGRESGVRGDESEVSLSRGA